MYTYYFNYYNGIVRSGEVSHCPPLHNPRYATNLLIYCVYRHVSSKRSMQHTAKLDIKNPC